MRVRFIILITLLLAGCRPAALWFVAPEGPPDYQLGWQDGCDTGLSAEDANYMYRLAYGFKKRPEMAENDQYKSGWSDGMTYCRFVLDTTQ